MTDDLVKELRQVRDWRAHQAADRIEKLEEENSVLFAANVRLNSRADLDCDHYRDRIKKLEAALREIARTGIWSEPAVIAQEALAELEGNRNERSEN